MSFTKASMHDEQQTGNKEKIFLIIWRSLHALTVSLQIQPRLTALSVSINIDTHKVCIDVQADSGDAGVVSIDKQLITPDCSRTFIARLIPSASIKTSRHQWIKRGAMKGKTHYYVT